MAAQEVDDFGFDEHGVYREHGSHGSGDQGIQLDEDGIWRDDADHWSHQTYRTFDSGIAFADRKFVSPAGLNRLPPESGENPYSNYSRDSYTTDSLPPDEQSLNISELEASESYIGDEISYGQRSYRSDENLDLPELHDESYLVGSEVSRERGTGSVASYSDYGDGKAYRRGYAHSEYSNSGDYQRAEKPLDSRTNSKASLNYGGSSSYGRKSPEKLSASASEKAQKIEQPKIIGDSLFTQDDILDGIGGHSLVEFEQLEAEALAPPGMGKPVGGENPADNMDLIGAYLQGLEEGSSGEQAHSGGSDDYTRRIDHAEYLRDLDSHEQDDENGSSPGEEYDQNDSGPKPSKIPMLRPGSVSPTMGQHRSMSPGYRQSRNGPFAAHSRDDKSQSMTALPQNEEADQFTPLQNRKSGKVGRSHGSIAFGSQTSKASPDTPEAHSSAASCDEMDELSQSSVLSTRSKDLKKRFLREKEERKEKEQNLTALEKEYNMLLKKHAAAENIIDKMRLGAKVSLHSDAPAPATAQAGRMPGPQRAQSFSMLKIGTATMGEIGVNNRLSGSLVQLSSNHAARPDSRLSHGSAATWTAPSSAGPPGLPSGHPQAAGPAGDGLALPKDEADAIAEEAVKLSLLTKAQGIDEQATNFQLMLSENNLSLDKQEENLKSIKDGVETLHQNYRDAKQQHEYLRRQGLVGGATGRESVFDDSNEINGEIHQLDMKVDNLDQQVQENLKKKTVRVPFQSPMKADHKIDVSGVNDGPTGGTLRKAIDRSLGKRGSVDSEGEGLSPRRPPSVGSIVGAAGDIDETLHKLNKDYNSLMDQYRMLKQLKRTPERDKQIEDLLTTLKQIYVNTPDHRKPALPPELENLYNPVEGAFLTPEEQSEAELRARLEEHRRSAASPGSRRDRELRREHQRAREKRGERRRGDSTSTTPGMAESSDFSASERGSRKFGGRQSGTDYGSSSTAERSHRSRRPGLRDLPGADSSSGTSRDRHRDHSDPRSRSSGSVRSMTSSLSGSRVLPSKPGVRTYRRDRGGEGQAEERGRNEGERRRGGTRTGKESASVGSSSGRSRNSHHHPLRTSALGSGNHDYSDSESVSSASTVEERRTQRARHGSGSDGRRKKSHSKAADSSLSSQDSFTRARHSESEEVSMISGGKALKHGTVVAASQGQMVNGNVVATSTSAFTINQVQPGIVQPRAVQAGQVQAGVMPNGVTTYVQQPQYQYVQQSAAVQPSTAGVPQVPAVQGGTAVVSAAVPAGPQLQQVQQTQVQPTHPPQMQVQQMQVPQQSQILGSPQRPVVQRPGAAGTQYPGTQHPGVQYPGYGSHGNVQAPRPQDRLASSYSHGQLRGKNIGSERRGGRSQTPDYEKSRYRTADALVDSDLRYKRPDLYRPEKGTDYEGRDASDRNRHRRESPYDYRKRFEEIREERYGKSSSRSPTRRYDSPSYEYSSLESRDRRPRDYHRSSERDRDYDDYGDGTGYYSDPDSPYRSPDRSERYREYNVHRRPRSREYYDDDDYYHENEHYGHQNGYDSVPLDEKYLTGTGSGYQPVNHGAGAYPQYNGDIAQGVASGNMNGYSGGGGVAMATGIQPHHIGVQNVPQMSSTGVQYVPQNDPNFGIYNTTGITMAGGASGGVEMVQTSAAPQVMNGYASGAPLITNGITYAAANNQAVGIPVGNSTGIAQPGVIQQGSVNPATGTLVTSGGGVAVNAAMGTVLTPSVQAVNQAVGAGGQVQGQGQPMVLMTADGQQTQTLTAGQLPAGTSYIPVQVVQGETAPQLTNSVQGTLPTAVLLNGSGEAAPAVYQLANNSTPTPTPTGKVRYYVREFGLDSDLEEPKNKPSKKANAKRSQPTPKKSSRARYDYDDDLETDGSLSDWRPTSHLEKRRTKTTPQKLNSSLHRQLLRSYHN